MGGFLSNLQIFEGRVRATSSLHLLTETLSFLPVCFQAAEWVSPPSYGTIVVSFSPSSDIIEAETAGLAWTPNPPLLPAKGKVQQCSRMLILWSCLPHYATPSRLWLMGALLETTELTSVQAGSTSFLKVGALISLTLFTFILFLLLCKCLAIILLFHWDKCGPSAEEQYKLVLTPTSPLSTQKMLFSVQRLS